MKISSVWLASFLCLSPLVSDVRAQGAYETPPVLKATDLAPKDIPLKGARYAVDPELPTDGFLAEFTIRSDFGTVVARGPGVLRMRVAEVDALDKLAQMEKSDVFVDALKKSGSDLGHAMVNIVTNTAEVAKAVPASVGRFFERTARQAKTGFQKLGDVKEGKDPGAARGAAPSTNQQNMAVAGGVAAGRTVRDFFGYDEQRRHLAKSLRVDPYTTNPLLKKQLDDIAWAAFAGGLGVDVLASSVPGGRLVQSSSVLSDWIYEKPPGDLKVWIEKTLQEIGVAQDTIDLFLRHKAYTLTTQTAIVMALEKMKGVAGRPDVVEYAVTLDTEDEARFIASGISMLARENEKTPLKEIIAGKPTGLTRNGNVIVCAPVDYVSWTERTATFANRDDLLPRHPKILLTGRLSQRARGEIKSLGWEIQEQVPLVGNI